MRPKKLRIVYIGVGLAAASSSSCSVQPTPPNLADEMSPLAQSAFALPPGVASMMLAPFSFTQLGTILSALLPPSATQLTGPRRVLFNRQLGALDDRYGSLNSFWLATNPTHKRVDADDFFAGIQELSTGTSPQRSLNAEILARFSAEAIGGLATVAALALPGDLNLVGSQEPGQCPEPHMAAAISNWAAMGYDLKPQIARYTACPTWASGPLCWPSLSHDPQGGGAQFQYASTSYEVNIDGSGDVIKALKSPLLWGAPQVLDANTTNGISEFAKAQLARARTQCPKLHAQIRQLVASGVPGMVEWANYYRSITNESAGAGIEQNPGFVAYKALVGAAGQNAP